MGLSHRKWNEIRLLLLLLCIQPNSIENIIHRFSKEMLIATVVCTGFFPLSLCVCVPLFCLLFGSHCVLFMFVKRCQHRAKVFKVTDRHTNTHLQREWDRKIGLFRFSSFTVYLALDNIHSHKYTHTHTYAHSDPNEWCFWTILGIGFLPLTLSFTVKSMLWPPIFSFNV